MDTCLLDDNALKLNQGICLWHLSAERTASPLAHSFLMIAFVARGKGLHMIGGKEISVSEGDLFVVNPHTPHCFCSSSEENMKLYYCCFSPEFLPEYRRDLPGSFPSLQKFFSGQQPFLHVRDNRRREFQTLFCSMLEDFSQALPCCQQTLKYSVLLLLCKICRASQAAGAAVPYSPNKTVDNAIRLIFLNYNQRLTVDDLAANLSISASQLNRLFVRHTGMSVIRYLNRLRVEKMKYLLLNTDRPIDLILAEYDLTPKYLNNLFRQHTGCSMYRFRKDDGYCSKEISQTSSCTR